MDDSVRRLVPIGEAIRRIGRKKRIHTFRQGGFCLIGADHDRDDLIAAMRKYGVEDAGPSASARGHTLVIPNYPTWDADRTAPLFIEARQTHAEAHPVASVVADDQPGEPHE